MKRGFVLVSILLILSVSLIAGGQSEAIKLGVAGPHTGDLASYGIPTVHAAELVVEKVNAAGGINGSKIELIIEDEQCKAEIATNTASKLVGSNVAAVIGHICSGATKAALGIYNDAKVLAISPSATTPDLTQSGDYPNFLRTIASDDTQAKLAMDYVVGELGFKKLAVLHDKDDYGKGFAELAKQFAEEMGAKVVLFEGINPGAPDYSAVVNKIGNANVDLVVWGGYHPEASKLIQQMRDKGMDTAFVSADSIKDNEFLAVAGKYAEGVYATGPTDTSKNPLAIAAVKAHVAKYGEEPGAFFLNAYAATEALVNAIKKAGSTDYDAVMKALKSEYVDTCLGNISFDAKGDVIGFGFQVFQVQNGQFAVVGE